MRPESDTIDRIAPDAPPKARAVEPRFDGVVRGIGRRLRDLYPHPEVEPLPLDQVQKLLELRHKERNSRRAGHA